MMYHKKLVASLKCNGRVLREHGDSVFLPFGSEYSLLLKNTENRKVVVDVFIDGRTAIEGLIIHPFQNTELERFFEGDMKSGHRFKFIEKTQEIEDYRGNRLEDGIVEIRYRFEMPTITRTYEPYSPLWAVYGTGQFDYYTTGNSAFSSQNVVRSQNVMQNDQGITVEGSKSNQSFQYGYVNNLERETHSIVLNLKGKTSQNCEVQAPLEVKTKIQCHTCGRRNTSCNKFCGNCGTALI